MRPATLMPEAALTMIAIRGSARKQVCQCKDRAVWSPRDGRDVGDLQVLSAFGGSLGRPHRVLVARASRASALVVAVRRPAGMRKRSPPWWRARGVRSASARFASPQSMTAAMPGGRRVRHAWSPPKSRIWSSGIPAPRRPLQRQRVRLGRHSFHCALARASS